MKILTNFKNVLFSEVVLLIFVVVVSVVTTYISYRNNTILAYGDAAAHMNIAKRTVDSLTPGFGQLGSVWLPLQHISIMPFLWNDFMWRSGLAGSIVSMVSYVFSSLFIYKTLKRLNISVVHSTLATLVYALNPNILYMQSTAMGELPLLCMYTGSIYFFIKWFGNKKRIDSLVFAAFFGFLGTLLRYDAWFLVGIETLIIIFDSIKNSKFKKVEGSLIVHGFLGYLGILFWLLWNFIIFGNPFNFFSGQYTAREQQMGWLSQGKLVTYMNPLASIFHYGAAALLNTGIIPIIIAVVGLFVATVELYKKHKNINLLIMLFFTPFIFYVFTLIIGNSILLVPNISTSNTDATMFNIRYGLMMIPFVSITVAYAFKYLKYYSLFLFLIIIGNYVYLIRSNSVITYSEGTNGIASRYVAGVNSTEKWFTSNYDGGIVFLNTYYGAVDILNLKIPMNKIIYEGSYLYWQNSLVDPSLYAKWIILKVDDKDPIWKSLKNNKILNEKFVIAYEKDGVRIYKLR